MLDTRGKTALCGFGVILRQAAESDETIKATVDAYNAKIDAKEKMSKNEIFYFGTLDVVRAAVMSDRCDDITLYTGNDDNIVIDLLTKYRFEKDGKTVERGFDGGLLGHWSVWTKKAVELFERIKAEKDKNEIPTELLTLAAEVTDTNSAFFDTAHTFKGCIAGLHEILRRQGLMKNIYCLNPDETLSEGQAAELDRVWKMYPHLNDDEFIRANVENWKKNI